MKIRGIGLVGLTVLGIGLWRTPAGGQQQLDPGAYAPGEILVKFARGVGPMRRGALMTARAATITRRFEELQLDHVRLPAGRTVAAALAELRNNPEIAFAQPNFVYRAVATPPPNDPHWLNNSLWGLQRIAAPETWQTFGSGNGTVIVADIDTGVMYTHPDLAANMWQNPGEIAGNSIDDDLNGYVDDVFGIDAINHDSNPMDDHGHGTHTSGTIAGVGNNGVGIVGVNWNAKILACKFMNAAGVGFDTGAIECFNYIIALRNRGENIRVSSNSWGVYRGSNISQALKNAVDAAGAAGILNVFAAGNDNLNIDVTPFDPASFSSSGLLSVAASDQSDNRANFSNYGVSSVDLAAPGVGIRSTIASGDYGDGAGTSMATPHVAGVAALLASLDPTLTVDNLAGLLRQNVDVLPQWAGLVGSGGRLNAFRAAGGAAPGPAPGGGASAVFVGVDATTRGDWPNLYGAAGYSMVGDATSLPAYATLTPSGPETWIWTASSSEARALRRATPPGRLAATWYQGTQFDLNIGLADGQPHAIALYCLDYDQGIRSQRLDVFDAATNALLDSRTIGNFSGGQYVVWTVSGNVRVRVTRLAGNNAVVSGVFFGAGSPINQPPTLAITSPAPSAAFAFGASIPITVDALDPDGTIASVAFYADGQLLNTDTGSPFAFIWPNATAGNHTLTAVATDNGGQPTTSAPVAIAVAAPPGGGASAVFLGVDATTRGDWPNLYGAAGYSMVGDATSLPAYATLTPSGPETWIWTASSSEARALRRATPPGRLAATWYQGTQFDLNIGLADGQPHTIALYCLDYDQGIRSQRLDVFDAATNALLDSRTIGNFSGGQYVVWTVSGNVRVRVTRLAGNNAVVSGVFFGGGSPNNQPPAISPSTIALRADFVGTLDAGGNATSPVGAGPHLLLLKQAGSLYRWDGAAGQEILSIASAPHGIAPIGNEAFLNVAANAAGTAAFVMFTSSTAPLGAPQHPSPRPGADAWQVLYKYDFNGTALSNPRAIVSLQVRSDGHSGGGMVVLSDGSVLFTTGDNGDAGEDGRQYAQDPGNYLSKILRIDPSTSVVTVLAVGVRNVQRLFVNPNSGDPRLEFADLGGGIAEELNSVRLADLLAEPSENFGWGRNASDNLAREGPFYIDSAGVATGTAPSPEPGFSQPIAQFGRESAQLVAITGTVSSAASFTNITALFGDLASGNVLAVIGAPGTSGQTVYRVGLVDGSLAPVTLAGLAGGRPDPRFFQFPDGTAGVLLERTGAFYRLTQISQ